MTSQPIINAQESPTNNKYQKTSIFAHIKKCPFSTALIASVVGSITTVLITILAASFFPTENEKVVYVMEPAHEQVDH